MAALVAAGDRAAGLGAVGSALAHYRHAVSLDDSGADDPHVVFRIGRTLLLATGEGADELEHAALALRDSDPAASAEAEILLGEAVWQRGDRDGSSPHFERAAAVVEPLPLSRKKAFVLSQVARFLVLGGRPRDALELIERVIEMATELGNDAILADALNTRGIARANLGDLGGIGDLERSLELILEADPSRAPRAYINLGSSLADVAGELERADQVTREGLHYAGRLSLGLSMRWFRGNLADSSFHLGNWDEALELAEGEIDDPETHYMQGACRLVRALIKLARGDTSGALEDARMAVALASEIRDPQALMPALAVRSFCLAAAGDTAESAVALTELERERKGFDMGGSAGAWIVLVAFTRLALGHELDLAEAECGVPTAWRDAVLALGRDDLAGAADVLRSIGSLSFEAHARLLAARQLAASGQKAEAASQLAVALAFYRGVGATAAVRTAEEFLPAAG